MMSSCALDCNYSAPKRCHLDVVKVELDHIIHHNLL